jgi:hypothetical protein
MLPVVVTIDKKRKAERRLRQLLSEGGFAQPEEVQYGPACVRLLWYSVNKSIVVDVTDRGDVGETRAGPTPLDDAENGDEGGPYITAAPPQAATLEQKRRAEEDARAMLEHSGLPQPDRVEYGDGCIYLFWDDTKLVLVVDITNPPVTKDRL